MIRTTIEAGLAVLVAIVTASVAAWSFERPRPEWQTHPIADLNVVCNTWLSVGQAPLTNDTGIAQMARRLAGRPGVPAPVSARVRDFFAERSPALRAERYQAVLDACEDAGWRPFAT